MQMWKYFIAIGKTSIEGMIDKYLFWKREGNFNGWKGGIGAEDEMNTENTQSGNGHF